MPPATARTAVESAHDQAPPAPALPRVAVDLRALVPTPTGIGVYTRSLLAALARRGGMRYLGLAHRPLAPARGTGELEALGVVLEHQAARGSGLRPRLLGVAWQQLLLPRRLARGDVDLFWSPLITLPLRCPVPAVATVHDLTVLLLPEAHRFKVRWSLLPFLSASLESARRVVTLARATADDLAFHFPRCAAKLRVVNPGIDPEFRPARPEQIAATRERLGAPDGYLLYAGTLEPRKNVTALLDAWESLAGDDPSFPPLVLAGPYGWGSRGLAERIAALSGRGVVALGHLERAVLVEVFQGAKLFVYPSLYEGFGLPPAEALACGVPAVAAASSSLPEVVGDAGVLVEPGSAAALAAALHQLQADPARLAALAARARAQAARFTWERAAREMEEVFGEALE
ncbi:MAG TPA: glycosyltransferase family 1 protein [Thermoanaerobaculia bacterium]|nr:glycosyltransferase family 1 protein [Thermoanaerobaculia bacterium]